MQGPRLSSPVADFKVKERIFRNCLLVHKLLATGRGEEVLQRWDQISPSVLLHKCQYVEHLSTEKKVTALHLATEFSPIAVVEAIAQACITLVDDEEEQCTLLHSAVLHNEVDIVRLLLDHGADVGALDRQGRMPLHYAAMSFILLENDAKVGRNSEVDIVKLLVNNGADVNARDKHKHTPLHYASKKASADVIKVLVDAGADISARDDEEKTPLHKVAKHNPSADAVRVMVEAGADLDAEDCFQWTPMHRAALDNPGAVRVLIESGAKVNKLNKDQIYESSVTPLFYAAKYSHRDAIIALCAAGADPRLGDLSPLDADCVKDDMKTLIREQFPVRSSSLIC